jgi:hypothetical protein
MPFPTNPSLFDKVSSLYDFKSEEVYLSSEAVDTPRISLICEMMFERLKECYHYWAYQKVEIHESSHLVYTSSSSSWLGVGKLCRRY